MVTDEEKKTREKKEKIAYKKKKKQATKQVEEKKEEDIAEETKNKIQEEVKKIEENNPPAEPQPEVKQITSKAFQETQCQTDAISEVKVEERSSELEKEINTMKQVTRNLIVK